MGLDFTTTVTDPPQTPDPGAIPDPFSGVFASDDLTCIVCGTPIMYGGRGPKPKYCEDHKGNKSSSSSGGGSTRRSTTDKQLEQACETMQGYYEGLSMVLMFVSPNAAAVWETRAEKLDKTNRTFLANNPKLVKRINSTGEKSGTAAFIGTHVLALLPVAAVVASDFRAGAQARAEARAQDDESYAEFIDEGPVSPVDPDFTFVRGGA